MHVLIAITALTVALLAISFFIGRLLHARHKMNLIDEMFSALIFVPSVALAGSGVLFFVATPQQGIAGLLIDLLALLCPIAGVYAALLTFYGRTATRPRKMAAHACVLASLLLPVLHFLQA
jgi:hypothetical protein